MSSLSKFAKELLNEINNFRKNPQSIEHQCDLARKGLSRLRANDPFLDEIDRFIKELKSKKPVPQLELNEVLCEAAKAQLPNFRGKPSFAKYRRADNLKGIVPDYYMVAAPAMLADDGADEPINVLTKILLDKTDLVKEGRNIILDQSFTQIGIGHEIFEDENMVIILLATRFVADEPEYELPDGDLSELKKAFDILDTKGTEILDMKLVMETMQEMKFEETDPVLFDIFDEISNKDTCSWPKFAYFANRRMTDRSSEDGLRDIFELFIDDPKKQTITFQTFKKICDEIDCGLTEQELKDILVASTENGNEITFDEFYKYMHEEGGEDKKEPKQEKSPKKNTASKAGKKGKK